MVKVFSSRILWGILLIVGGLIFLVESLGLVELGSVWGLIFAAAGVVFLGAFATARERWWAAIPGMTLLGLGVLIGMDSLVPGSSDMIGGPMFLGFLALAFILVYLATRGQQWWALIPGGVLGTLAVIIALEEIFPNVFRDELFVGVMFLGFAATFALIALLPHQGQGMRWAFWPAGVMAIMGLIFAAIGAKWAGLVWPAALVVGGIYLILRNARKSSSSIEKGDE